VAVGLAGVAFATLHAQAQWAAKVGFDSTLQSAGQRVTSFLPSRADKIYAVQRYPPKTEAAALACGTRGAALAAAAAMWGYVTKPRLRVDVVLQILDVGMIGAKGLPMPELTDSQRALLTRAYALAKAAGYTDAELAELKENLLAKLKEAVQQGVSPLSALLTPAVHVLTLATYNADRTDFFWHHASDALCVPLGLSINGTLIDLGKPFLSPLVHSLELFLSGVLSGGFNATAALQLVQALAAELAISADRIRVSTLAPSGAGAVATVEIDDLPPGLATYTEQSAPQAILSIQRKLQASPTGTVELSGSVAVSGVAVKNDSAVVESEREQAAQSLRASNDNAGANVGIGIAVGALITLAVGAAIMYILRRKEHNIFQNPHGMKRMPTASDVMVVRKDAVEWVKMHDPKTSRDYYFNSKTGESSWLPPPGFQPEKVEPGSLESMENVRVSRPSGIGHGERISSNI